MNKGNENSSWFSGTCIECGYPVVVTQPNSDLFPAADYWWYCSNPKCTRHSPGTHTGDMEQPEWVEGTAAPLDVVYDPPIEEIPPLGASTMLFKTHEFTGKKGQKIVDGKSYYPDMLRLNVEPWTAWRIVHELLAYLKEGDPAKEQTQIVFFGQLDYDTKEEE